MLVPDDSLVWGSLRLAPITKLIDLQHELTQCFEDEESTMRSELAKKENHIEELKKENEVAKKFLTK